MRFRCIRIILFRSIDTELVVSAILHHLGSSWHPPGTSRRLDLTVILTVASVLHPFGQNLEIALLTKPFDCLRPYTEIYAEFQLEP